MKKVSICILVAVVFAGTAPLAMAQTSGRQNPAQKTQNVVSREIEKNQASTSALGVRQRLEMRYGSMTNRFQATIDRLQNIESRLETRIAKIKALGGNTTVAEKALSDAKKAIEDAKAQMASLKNYTDLADNTISSTTAKELKVDLTNMQKSSASIKKLLVQAHTSMTKVIGTLRGLKVGQTATSTPKTGSNATSTRD